MRPRTQPTGTVKVPSRSHSGAPDGEGASGLPPGALRGDVAVRRRPSPSRPRGTPPDGGCEDNAVYWLVFIYDNFHCPTHSVIILSFERPCVFPFVHCREVQG